MGDVVRWLTSLDGEAMGLELSVKRMSQDVFERLDESALDLSVRMFKSGESVPYVPTLQELHPDPVERIEYLYGPKERPYVRTHPTGMRDTWDEDRLAIATNPEYTDRCRESYAFADLLGREYNGVVFG